MDNLDQIIDAVLKNINTYNISIIKFINDPCNSYIDKYISMRMIDIAIGSEFNIENIRTISLEDI